MERAQPILARWLTAADFQADRAFEHNYYLLDGEVFEDMGNAHRPHEIVKSRLLRALFRCLDQYQINAGIFPETGYELTPYTVLIPDISIQLPERASGPGFFHGSPEIAIEILSPSNSKHEIDRKARAYWAHGAKAVWVFDPDSRRIFTVDSTGQWIETDRLEMYGFLVDTADVWPT